MGAINTRISASGAGAGGGGGGGSSITSSESIGDGTGDHTSTATSYAVIDAQYTQTIAAVEGDQLLMILDGTLNAGVNHDMTWRVGATDLTGCINNVAGNSRVTVVATRTVVAGDISGGNVTVTPVWLTTSGTMILRNADVGALTIRPRAVVYNLGQ